MPNDHERSDVGVRGIVWCGVGLVGFVLAALGVSTLFYRGLGRQEQARQREEPAASALAPIGPGYGGPLLQVAPEEELAAMRAENARDLGRYAWEDRAAGAVRIPITEAMAILARRGLPPASGPPVTFEELQRQRGEP